MKGCPPGRRCDTRTACRGHRVPGLFRFCGQWEGFEEGWPPTYSNFINIPTGCAPNWRDSPTYLKTVRRTACCGSVAAAALSSPFRRKKVSGHPFWDVLKFGTPEGTRYTMVLASSSRRQANVHRTLTFYCSSPKTEIIRTRLSPRTGSDHSSLVRVFL